VSVDRYHTVIGIDPGSETSGLVIARIDEALGDRVSIVLDANKAATVEEIRDTLRQYAIMYRQGRVLVALERVAPGQSSWTLTQTSELCGRIREMVYNMHPGRGEKDLCMLTRRDVLRMLRVVGRGAERDKLVRHALIGMHGGVRSIAVGSKKSPGPLHGVSSHSWAALAVAIAARIHKRETQERALSMYGLPPTNTQAGM